MPLPTQQPALGTLTWTVSTRLQQPDGSWGSWQPLQPVPFGTGSFVVRGLQAGGVYEFRVNDNTNTYNQVLLLYGGILRPGDFLWCCFVYAFKINVNTKNVITQYLCAFRQNHSSISKGLCVEEIVFLLFLREKRKKENAGAAGIEGAAYTAASQEFHSPHHMASNK